MTHKRIEVNGHKVDAAKADYFFDGKTGEPITDEQWDEAKRRLAGDNTGLVPPEFR